MIIKELIETYGFENPEENKIIIVTDFEKIIINMTDKSRYSFFGESFIRFLKEGLLDEFPYTNEDFIDSAFFLPTDKCNEFEDSLANEEILGELKTFYNPEYHKSFNIGPHSSFIDEPIPNKDKGSKGISLYGADAMNLSQLIDAAKQILELNAMKDYEIAYGDIVAGIGLLERSPKERDTTPKSRHYNFWKFREDITGKKFSDIACHFQLIKKGILTNEF